MLAILVPDRYQQMITRGAEYGNDRIIMGAHYAMDVIGGRTLAIYDLAHLLANDPAYMGRTLRRASAIKDFQVAVTAARADVTASLQAACGNKISVCAHQDIGRMSNPAANEAFYAVTQTYNLPAVHAKTADGLEDVAELVPEAGYLLTIAFPALTLEQADQILTETEGPEGGFLDDGSAFGVIHASIFTQQPAEQLPQPPANNPLDALTLASLVSADRAGRPLAVIGTKHPVLKLRSQLPIGRTHRWPPHSHRRRARSARPSKQSRR